MLPESFLNELKFRSDIESTIGTYVTLKRKGRNLTGLCPFHSEKTPSFTVYPENQSFYCFGCGAGGDAISFIKRVENLDYIEAVRSLASRVGMELPENTMDDTTHKLRMKIQEMNRIAAKYFHNTLMSSKGDIARSYLANRGMTLNMVKKFGIGYAQNDWQALTDHLQAKGYTMDEISSAALGGKGKNGGMYDLFRHRVMFPIIDIRGGIIGFGGRLLDGDGPKYLNSSDTLVFKKSRNLFAMNFAKSSKRKELILAEGYMDVVSIFQGGFDNAVATLGTSLTEEQARVVASYTDQVVIAYDSDGAGQSATKRAVGILEKTGVKIKILSMAGAKDPDEFIKKFGADRFENLLTDSKSALDFEINKLYIAHDTETSDGKVNFMQGFTNLMADTKNPIERDVYMSKVCNELNINRQAVTLQVESMIKKRNYSFRKREAKDLKTFVNVNPMTKADFGLQKNPTLAVAEQRIIAYLMKHPNDYIRVVTQVDSSQFVSPIDMYIYNILAQRLQDSLSIDMMSVCSVLEDDHVNRLAQINSSISGQNICAEEVDDYIKAIKKQSQEKKPEEIGKLEDADLEKYLASIIASKK